MLGMMTALVFVSNYLRITMPIAIGGRTSFTLANIMCCLSGLLLGPVGGVALRRRLCAVRSDQPCLCAGVLDHPHHQRHHGSGGRSCHG